MAETMATPTVYEQMSSPQAILVELRHRIAQAVQAKALADTSAEQQAALAALNKFRGPDGYLSVPCRLGGWAVELYEIAASPVPRGPVCSVVYTPAGPPSGRFESTYLDALAF